MLIFLGYLQSSCFRSVYVRASIIQAGAHRRPRICHKRYPSGLHLSFGGGRRGFTGTAERLSWHQKEPFGLGWSHSHSRLWGAKGAQSVPEHVSPLAQKLNLLPEVLCSISKLGSSCSCGVQTSVRCFSPETLVLHAQNNRYSLHSLLAQWQTGNHTLDPSDIHSISGASLEVRLQMKFWPQPAVSGKCCPMRLFKTFL